MHMGAVVTGEVGTIKHEIVYLGDTLNVAARIEQACRQFQRSVLISSDVIKATTLPPGACSERLGPVDLRGIASPMKLFAVKN